MLICEVSTLNNGTYIVAWKLTHVLRGWSKLPLLQTYESERRQYAQDLIAFDKHFAALFSAKATGVDGEDTGVSHDEFLEAFQTYGDFTSGVGIHYATSAVVDPAHQAAAPGLVVGMRVPPQVLVRAADARPYELQDLLPADGRYKLLVFGGDLEDAAQKARVERFAEELEAEKGFMKQVCEGKAAEWCDVMSVVKGNVHTAIYTAVPEVLRPHWSKYALFIFCLRVGANVCATKGVPRRAEPPGHRRRQGLRRIPDRRRRGGGRCPPRWVRRHRCTLG
jgi:phenol 2-monooxygenase